MGVKKRVAVVFGGRSGEHDVSLMSARSIIRFIDREKFDVVPVGITRDGRWIMPSDPAKALELGLDAVGGEHVAILGDPSVEPGLRLVNDGVGAGGFEPVDVVFPILHGTYGEDGTVQGLLDLAGIPYVGPGVLGSAAGMDKEIMKALFTQAGLPVVDYKVYKRKDWEQNPNAILDDVEACFAYPCFVKPANLGSSVGVSKARDRDGLAAALGDAARYDRKLIVETAVPEAREIECSVLGNDEPIASIVGEVVPCNEFYDYRAKYLDDASELIIPADLPADLVELVREYSIRAYQALDCAGLSRVDFLLSQKDNQLFINEVNTIPGFTHASMYPRLWEASGISYPELITRLIELAIERHDDKKKSTTFYSAT